MAKSANYRSQRHSKVSEKNAEPPEPDGSCRKSCFIKYSHIKALYKHLLAYPLALSLLILTCIYILFRRGDSHRKGSVMFRDWPRLSLFKAYVQKILRDIWRNPQPNRYAR